MQIARVCGTVVSTLKHPAIANHKLLIVQPYDLEGQPRGRPTSAIDVVDAGVGDWVLVLDEGSSASLVLENPRGPVRTLVVGVIDLVSTGLGGQAGLGAPLEVPPHESAVDGARAEPPEPPAGGAAIQDGTRG